MKTKIILFHFILIPFIVNSCDLFDGEVEVNFQLQKTNYTVADTLKGTFTVSNFTSDDITYQFSSSCEYNLFIKSGNNVLRNYPEICAHVMLRITLKESETKTYDIQLPLVDSNYQNLDRGEYTIEIGLANNNSRLISKQFSIK
ncbi:MAG: hypothetical protein IH950_12215 [Bacteroidetes bacterium]|nr:hypothetical protein [Bacteroidota bacterium]MCH8034503.1 hypothetical protein [Bacteroidota bacterium]